MNATRALSLIFLTFLAGSLQDDPQCLDSQFIVKKGDTVYLAINTETEVKTCGGLNICDEIKKQQSLSLSTDGVLSISGDPGKVQLPDDSDKNEIQSLTLSQDGTLSLSVSNSVVLPDTSASNEIQTLSLDSAGKLSITSGNSVTLLDPSPTNELQTLTINGADVELSANGGKITLPDSSSTNELQNLSLSTSTNLLNITNGNSVDLSYLKKPTLFRALLNKAYSLPLPGQPPNQFLLVPFDTAQIDTAQGYVPGGSYKTVEAGWYSSSVMLAFTGTASASYYIETRLFVNEVSYSLCIFNAALSSIRIFGTQCNDNVYLNVNDAVAIKVHWNGPDSTLPLLASDSACVWNLNKISDTQ